VSKRFQEGCGAQKKVICAGESEYFSFKGGAGASPWIRHCDEVYIIDITKCFPDSSIAKKHYL
jgi:hypothetical protein